VPTATQLPLLSLELESLSFPVDKPSALLMTAEKEREEKGKHVSLQETNRKRQN